MPRVRQGEDVVLYATTAKCGRRSETLALYCIVLLLNRNGASIGYGFLQVRVRLQIQYQQLDYIFLPLCIFLYQYASAECWDIFRFGQSGVFLALPCAQGIGELVGCSIKELFFRAQFLARPLAER